jgi:hypothetical protein
LEAGFFFCYRDYLLQSRRSNDGAVMRHIVRNLLVLSLLVPLGGFWHGIPTAPIGWQRLAIGGGGYSTGIDINPTDGTILTRVDTYGAYKWNSGTQSWTQLNSQASMPAANFGFNPATNTSGNQVYVASSLGTYEVTSAPSNSSVIYLVNEASVSVAQSAQGHVFVSTNGGTTFTETGFGLTPNCSNCPLNGGVSNRAVGHKMAVSPQSADLVLLGTYANGVWVTTNGTSGNSATWAQISTATIPSASGYSIAFDSSDVTGKTAYVCGATGTNGVYVSTNVDQGASASWTQLTSGSPPAACENIMLAANTGVVLAIGTDFALYEYASSTWTKSPGSLTGTWQTVAVDPNQCATIGACHIVLGGNSGASLKSTVTGPAGTWIAPATPTRVCSGSGSISADVGWLCTTSEFYMTSGNMAFDLSGNLWFAEGIGNWESTNFQNGGTGYNSGGAVTWNARSQGVEDLVSWSNIVAPNGVLILGVQDRGMTSVPSPTSYIGNSGLFTLGEFTSLTNTTGVDYATSLSSFMVASLGPNSTATFDWSATSSDSGATWQPFNQGWWALISGAALSAATSVDVGTVRVTLTGNVLAGQTTVSGLTSWSAGPPQAGNLITLLQQGQSCAYTSGCNLSGNSYEIVVNPVAACNCFDLLHTSFAGHSYTNGNYLIFIPAFPPSTHNGSYLVQGVASGAGGAIQLTVQSYATAPATGYPINVSGTTCCDGWWIASATSGANTLLQDSSYTNSVTNGSAWSGAGQIGAFPFTGGGVAASTPSNFIKVPDDDEYPYCTTNGGQSWTEIGNMGTLANGAPHYSTITNAVWDGVNTVTFTTTNPVNIQTNATDKKFYVAGVNQTGGAGYNGSYTVSATNYGSAPYTISATGVSSNPGTYTAPSAGQPSGTLIPGGPGNPAVGWGWYVGGRHIVAADRSTTNTFYMYNYNVAAIYTVTNCTVTNVGHVATPGSSGDLAYVSNFAAQLVSVPGNAGHLFFTAGETGGGGGNHPAASYLWRSCDGGNTMAIVADKYGNEFYETWGVGVGAAKLGGTGYPAIYVWGWLGAGGSSSGGGSVNNAVLGLWRSADDASSGSSCSGGTWQQITSPTSILGTWPLGWQSIPASYVPITGSNTYGQVFMGINNGFVYGTFPYLLERDLDPASNDNSPVGLEHAA